MGDSESRDGSTGPALETIRERLESLAVPAGAFVVRCARTGASPVPVEDRRFADRSTAARAARLTSAYRARLRQWDRRTPYCDPVVHEEPVGDEPCHCGREGRFPPSLVERVRDQQPESSEGTPGEEDTPTDRR